MKNLPLMFYFTCSAKHVSEPFWHLSL